MENKEAWELRRDQWLTRALEMASGEPASAIAIIEVLREERLGYAYIGKVKSEPVKKRPTWIGSVITEPLSSNDIPDALL